MSSGAGAPVSSVERGLVGQLVDWQLGRPVAVPRLPVAHLTPGQKAVALARLQREKAVRAAYEAELIVSLAADRPATLDPPPGTPGARSGSWAPDAELPGVSEFFVPELAVALNSGRVTANLRAVRAWVWAHTLTATFAALTAGELDEPRAAALADVLGVVDPDLARRIEARLLPIAAELSVGRLRARATALLVELDPEGTDARRKAAQRGADVRVHPAPAEGMSTLATDMSTPDAQACRARADAIARALKAAGDVRPIGQLRAAAIAALILHPHEALPAVTASVTVHAPLRALAGRGSAVVDGQPITAAQLRELLGELGALGLRAPAGGSLALALTDPDGTLRAALTPDQLARLARRGCREHPTGDCACPLLGLPPDTDGYTPTAAQKLFVKTRDRTCRWPHCSRPVGLADCDHVVPHAAGGATSCTNLCCLCRFHHRLKTFAPGWTIAIDPDGTLHVTTPSGLTHTTRPPGLLDNSTAESPPDPGGPSRGEDDRPGDAPPPY